eukprot:6201491-Pleurochrysis_carterae.AAC.4
MRTPTCARAQNDTAPERRREGTRLSRGQGGRGEGGGSTHDVRRAFAPTHGDKALAVELCARVHVDVRHAVALVVRRGVVGDRRVGRACARHPRAHSAQPPPFSPPRWTHPSLSGCQMRP